MTNEGERRAPATLRDVAAAAGVSIRTVSNVVTGAVVVSPGTRSRVEAAVEALGYRPNLAARRLRSGRSQVIGLVVPDITVPYFREFADAVLAAAGEAGFAVVIEQTSGDLERERSVLRDPRLRHVDGIVLTAIALAPEDVAELVSSRPVVLAGATVRSDLVDSVAPDAEAASRAVAELVLRLGRRRPVVIAPENTRWAAARSDRLQGFVDGLADAGERFDAEQLVVAHEVTLAEGRLAVARALAAVPDLDCVYALGDALALGALRGLRDAGKRVPEDVAVIGYGDVELAAHSMPTLTTVDSGRVATARLAVSAIRSRLAAGRGPGSSGPLDARHLVVDSALVERESTGGARG